jgi:hypothetical protein
MNEPKPVYCIKSRGGKIVKEGNWSDVVNWFREERITSDDELRRLGFYVLEKDELWARVKDFPEFPDTERQGRQALYRARNRAYLSMAAGIVLASLGFALICYDQLIPRYTESNRVDEAKAETRSAKELERVAYEKLKQARDEAAAALKEKDAAHLRSVALLKKQLDESREELNLALAQKQGELKDARGKLDDLSGRVSSDLASANRRVTQLTRQLEQLTRQLEEERKEAAVAQKPLKEQLAELQAKNDALYSLYIRTNEQLKAEQGKSIAQKVFGLSSDKGE